MAVTLSSSQNQKTFTDQLVIVISSKPEADFYIPNTGTDFELILESVESENKYTLLNNSDGGPKFKGESFTFTEIKTVSKLLFEETGEFINIKVLSQDEKSPVQKTVSEIEREDFNEDDIKNLYPDDKNAYTRIKIERAKAKIEDARVAVRKEVGHKIADIKKKISGNIKCSVFAHFGLVLASVVCAFGVTNYLSGLSIKESADYIHLPTDIKLWVLYTVLILSVNLIMKQGIFGYFQSLSKISVPKISKTAQYTLIGLSSVIMFGVYVINLIYYLDYTNNIIFPLFMSLFFVGITVCIAIAAGYFKSNGFEFAELLNKYEYREDFEKIIKEYQTWIGHYVNNLSDAKLKYVSDTAFMLRIKEAGETIIGILTAPFLAYGVSNTLALCFPEAAGWVRISGLRFSPVFLVLATFLIIFAFFLFVHAFTCSRKIGISDVIKQDGFSNYLLHCCEILGLEGTARLQKEQSFAFFVAVGIILIEFTMNVSYFSTEIGNDLSGLFLSFTAALVPTALLTAETWLLASTKFRIYACEEISAKVDK